MIEQLSKTIIKYQGSAISLSSLVFQQRNAVIVYHLLYKPYGFGHHYQ